MNNHDRAKKMADIVRRRLWSMPNERLEDAVLGALDATEPQRMTASEFKGYFDPKPRPAFLGDEVRGVLTGRTMLVVGLDQRDPRWAVVERDKNEYLPAAVKFLEHPDGAPVSRIIEHRRPIPVSERKPTKEDANAFGKVLAFWSDGDVLMAKWCAPALSTGAIVAWLPCPESGVE